MDSGKTAWGMHEKQNIKGKKKKEIIKTLKRSAVRIQLLEAIIPAFVEAGL
jgi:hypothetical protein